MLALASSIVIAHLVDPSELGRYALATAITSLLGMATSLQAGGYYIVTSDPSPRLLRTGLLLEVSLGAVVWLLLIGGAVFFVPHDEQMVVMLVLSGSVMVTNSFTSLSAFFTRELAYKKPVIAQTACFALSVVVKIVLVSLGMGPLGLVLGDVALSVTYGLALLIMIPEARGFAFDRRLARRQLGFGLPSLATGFMSNAMLRSQEFIVASVLGTHQLGFFYLASRLPAQIYQLWRTLSISLLPAFSRSSPSQLTQGLRMITRSSAFLVGLPVALVLPFGALIVTTLYGEQWEPAAVPFALLMATMAIRFVFYHTLTALKSRGRVGVMAVLTGAQLAVLVALSYLGVRLDGLVGLTIAAVVVEMLFVVPKVHLVRSVAGFEPAAILRTPLVALALAATVAAAADAFLPGLPGIVVGASAAVAIFSCIAWWADRETIRMILRALRQGPASDADARPTVPVG